MNYARIVEGTAVEIFKPQEGFTIEESMSEDFVKLFIEVPDDVAVSSTVDSKGNWTIAPLPEQPVIPPEPTPAEVWTSQIAAKRHQVSISGFIWNSLFIDTDKDSQTSITSAWTAAKEGLRIDGDIWKCGDVTTGQPIYRATTNAEMIEIGSAAFTFVQACYNREGVLAGAVLDRSITATMIDQGWPT